MRHLWRIQPNLTHEQWQVVLSPLHPRFPVHEFLLVHRRVGFVEPTYGWGGLVRASAEAQASGWGRNASWSTARRKANGGGRPAKWVFDYVPVR